MLYFTVQVSEADFLAANRRLLLNGWKPRQVLFAIVCGTIPLACAALISADQAVRRSGVVVPDAWPPFAPLALAISAGFAALFLVVRFVTCWYQLPGTSGKLHALTGTSQLPTTYRLSDERFQASYSEGTSDHPWTRFMDWVDAGTVLLLRRTPGFMFVIPKHQLTKEQLHELIGLLVRVGVKQA